MKATITIRLKKGVLDPQGKAIENALHGLGHRNVLSARQGKLIELELAGLDPKQARNQLEIMCKELLANTVIEDYVIVLGDESSLSQRKSGGS